MLLALLLACGAHRASDPRDTAEVAEGAPRAPSFALGAGCVAPAAAHFVLAGGTVDGVGRADVEVDQGRIVSVGPAPEGGFGPDVAIVDVTGAWLTPAVIDSHVHLAYLPEGDEMARGGIAAVVDLAAPTAWLSADHAPLRVVASGPMITAVGGYPTEGWGRNGYGLEVTSAAEGADAVDTLYGLGARVIKLPVTSGPQLAADVAAAVVTRAHALGIPVVSHALDDADAALAAAAGIDALAHTPVSPLSAPTLAAWSGRAVISTLGAFGGSDAAVANLAALEAAGATILYGTDFGNSRTAGVNAGELALLVEAGLTPAEVIAATTSTPAAFWGLDDLGAIAPGKAASLLVLPGDPRVDPTVLASATAVYLDGVRME
ncbi:MAG: amidohydrolase family protein [Pseudomonadota bacterium]|nr:amidohydrolase family protein [Pseudomonadota bacterium]